MQGKYSAFNASTSCAECQAGTYSESTRATSKETCIKCAAGKFSGVISATTNSVCAERCGRGMYSTNEGSVVSFDETCMECPANANAPVGSNRLQNCTCNAGWTGPNGGPCSPCPFSTYKDSSGHVECTPCPSRMWSATRSVDVQDCMPSPIVSATCPKNPIQMWGSLAWSHCTMVWTQEELYEGYKNRSITWVHGSLGLQRREGKFEHYLCVKDDPCSVDLTDTFFCYVWSIQEETYVAWGPNSDLKLLQLPLTQDEVLFLRADVTQYKEKVQNLEEYVRTLTIMVRILFL